LAKVIYERSAGAVVFHIDGSGKREYLLLHYPSGHWDFPKGMLQGGDKLPLL